MMLLRPSLELYALLTANAALGHFVPYTRTEQDVLESALPLSFGVGRAEPYVLTQVRLPRHLHYFYHGCDKQGARDVSHPLPRRPCGDADASRQVLTAAASSAAPADPAGSATQAAVHRRRRAPVAGQAILNLTHAARLAVLSSLRLPEHPQPPQPPATHKAVSDVLLGIEWLAPDQPLGARARSGPFNDLGGELCGSAVELVERCDALLWRAARSSARATSSRGRRQRQRGGAGGAGGAAVRGNDAANVAAPSPREADVDAAISTRRVQMMALMDGYNGPGAQVTGCVTV